MRLQGMVYAMEYGLDTLFVLAWHSSEWGVLCKDVIRH
jgi:hypothetical protein